MREERRHAFNDDGSGPPSAELTFTLLLVFFPIVDPL